MNNNLEKYYEQVIDRYQKENKYLWAYGIIATLMIVLLITL